jgi:hypothetical protein
LLAHAAATYGGFHELLVAATAWQMRIRKTGQVCMKKSVVFWLEDMIEIAQALAR